MNKVATKIKQLREYNDLSQSYIAQELNISQSQYAKIESGSTNISQDRLTKIADIMGVDIEQLMSEDVFKLIIENNTLNDNSSIIRELNSKQTNLYERLLQEKNKRIEQLEKMIEHLMKKENG